MIGAPLNIRFSLGAGKLSVTIFIISLLFCMSVSQTALAALENKPEGSALRPLPLLMPLDYTGARAQAWLNALDKSLRLLPPAAGRRLADLGLSSEQTGGNSTARALASLLFPVDVITPQLSSSREIRVYLKSPDDFRELSRFFGNEETLALGAANIVETERELAALAEAWPATLDEARVKTASLEAMAGTLEALWQGRELYGPDRQNNLRDIEALADLAPNSPFIAYLYAEALLAAHKPQQSLQEASRLLENIARLGGEEKQVWNTLKPRIRHIRALAQWQLDQLALAEDDLNAALHEAANLPPETRANLLETRGNLKMHRKDGAGMCEDFGEACRLGFCQNLARARRLGNCPS